MCVRSCRYVRVQGFVVGQDDGKVTVFEKDEKEVYRRARCFSIENNQCKIRYLAIRCVRLCMHVDALEAGKLVGNSASMRDYRKPASLRAVMQAFACMWVCQVLQESCTMHAHTRPFCHFL